MAFTAGKSKEIEGKSNDWLLDQSLMQSMQDRFCDANIVYMVCLNAQIGVVTKAYGTKEELEYVYSKAGRERHVSLLDKMTGHSIESVVEEPLDTDELCKILGLDEAKMPDKYDIQVSKVVQCRRHKKKRINKKWAKKYGYKQTHVIMKGWKMHSNRNGEIEFVKDGE